MDINSHQKYFISVDNDEKEFYNFDEVANYLSSFLKLESGKINLSAVDGLRPWWQRFIFGLKHYVIGYFAIEWRGEVAGLIFYDENMSEYRVKTNDQVSIGEEIRNQISFGEASPLEEKYCLTKSYAVKAINEFMVSGVKPNWIEWDYVQ